MKKNDQKNKKSRKQGTCVCQFHPEKNMVKELWKEPELLELTSYEFMEY
jgi:hypothetical protein